MLAFMNAGAKSIAIAAIKAKSFGMLIRLYMRSTHGTFNLLVPGGTATPESMSLP